MICMNEGWLAGTAQDNVWIMNERVVLRYERRYPSVMQAFAI
jgi:hypothetical protein